MAHTIKQEVILRFFAFLEQPQKYNHLQSEKEIFIAFSSKTSWLLEKIHQRQEPNKSKNSSCGLIIPPFSLNSFSIDSSVGGSISFPFFS